MKFLRQYKLPDSSAEVKLEIEHHHTIPSPHKHHQINYFSDLTPTNKFTMGKKRKASEAEADDTPAFISQANAPAVVESHDGDTNGADVAAPEKRKKGSKKTAKPWIPSNYDPETNTHKVAGVDGEDAPVEKPDLERMSTHQLRKKPEGEKKGDKYARQKELRRRRKEEKEKFEKLKAESEGVDYVPPEKSKRQLKKEKKTKEEKAKKKQEKLSKKEKRKVVEDRRDRKKEKRRERKRLEEGETVNEDADSDDEKATKVTITTVEEVEEKVNGNAVERKEIKKDVVTVEPPALDKMDVDKASSSSSDSSDSESEEDKNPTKPSKKTTKKESNGTKSKPAKEETSSSSSSDSSDSESAEEKAPAPKSNGSTAPTSTNGTGTSTPADITVISSYMTTHSIKITDPEAPNTTSFKLTLNFSDLDAVDKSHLNAFSSYKTPTPIQAASWRYLLDGRDLIGVAETGSGKTMAFAYPAVQYLCKLPKHEKNPKKSGAKVVIVSPTRELAMQIHEQVATLTTAAGMKDAVTCIYGGVPKDSQREELKKALIIVATPGRLKDFLEEGAAKISEAGYVVLDEADRMLDKGFEDDIRQILGGTPATPKRQTLMFTATWPQSVRQLASTFMTKPIRIGINSPDDGDLRANTRITQTVHVLTDPRTKESRLINAINAHHRSSPAAKNDRILVFALYKKEAARLEMFLRSKGIKVGGIHGDLNQHTRTTTLAEFKAGRTPVLVATDVAARGLDIPNVKLVINVTFPLTIEDYVHRIGRTGRAGETGKAITFFTEHDKAHSGRYATRISQSHT